MARTPHLQINIPTTDPATRTAGPLYATDIDELIQNLEDLAPFSVKAYLALGNNSHDDTPNIQAAIDAASAAGGGRVQFPPGYYKCLSPLDLYGRTNVVLQGHAVPLNVNPVSVLRYEGGNVPRFIDARSSACIGLDGLSVFNASVTNTGYLVDFGEDFGGTVDQEVYFALLRNLCMFGNVAANTNCVHLGGAYNWLVKRARFIYYNRGLLGHAVGLSGVGPGGIGTVEKCEFDSAVTTPMWSPSAMWRVVGNVIQQDTSGKANAIRHGSDPGPSYGCTGLEYAGNWHGDVTNPGGCWIDYDGNGGHVAGNLFAGVGAATDAAVRADNAVGMGALEFVGNFLDNITGVDVGSVPSLIRGDVAVHTNHSFNGAKQMGGALATATGDTLGMVTNGSGADSAVTRLDIDPLMSADGATGNWTRTALAGLWKSGFYLDNQGDSTATKTWIVNLSRGLWRVETLSIWDADAAILTFTLDGVTMATLDSYTGGGQNKNGLQETSTGLLVPISGPHVLKLTVATKNGSSSNYYARLHGLRLRRAAT